MWWQQYKKELMSHRGGDPAHRGRPGRCGRRFSCPAGTCGCRRWWSATYWVPMGFLPLWALWTSVQLYRQEWRENTSYLMLSLPVRAWKITSAKLAALLTGVVGFVAAHRRRRVAASLARTGVLAELAASPEFAIVPREWMVKMALLAVRRDAGGLRGGGARGPVRLRVQPAVFPVPGTGDGVDVDPPVVAGGPGERARLAPCSPGCPTSHVRSLHIVLGIPEFAPRKDRKRADCRRGALLRRSLHAAQRHAGAGGGGVTGMRESTWLPGGPSTSRDAEPAGRRERGRDRVSLIGGVL